MFIVKKKISGKDYFYARKSKREGNKVKALTVAYLGKTRKEAEENFKKLLNKENKIDNMEQKQENKQEIKPLTIEELTNFCKRKGFVFKSSEIYGGLAGFWDYGPLGIELFNNIKNDFWRFFVHDKENIVGIDASIIAHPRTWKASGHLDNFNDVAVTCKKCKKSTKLDKSEVGKKKCECGGEYDVQGDFNLMFKTKIGALNSEDSYLRPETAQGMFLDFKQVYETSRVKLPFGILQIGKCFRNEIAPRDFIFRSREFTIAEFEFFIHPEDDKCDLLGEKHLNLKLRLLDKETQDKREEGLRETTIGKMLKEKRLGEWHGYWLAEQLLWFKKIGIFPRIKVREHMKSELSHYSSATFDMDYEFPFGSQEIAGNANRGQFDLKQHEKESKEKMEIFDEKTKSKIIPRVVEPTFGMDRIFLSLICNGYHFDEKRQNIVLKIPAYISPYKAAVFPIIKGDNFEKIAREIFYNLKKEFNVLYDLGGSLGRRYSRQDEIGTPYCITIDGDSLGKKDVTIRDRDTTKQIRVKIKDLKEVLKKLIFEEIEFEKAGKLVETRVKVD
jgi:glycyl-tRNA synthetase